MMRFLNITRGILDVIRIKFAYLALLSVIGGFAIAAFFSAGFDVHAASRTTTAPYIIQDGVRMVDAWNMPEAGWQAWLSRPPGDDTYGSGDLIAVSVQFNEKVTVNPNTAFKFSSGFFDTERQLVYVAQDGSKVFFATTVGPWHDDDGIHIGDGSATLGHNDPTFITGAASGVNADTAHPALGTLPDHKLNGSFSRPNITSFRILAPACDDAYLRDEKITVQVGFDQPVRVHGTPQAAIKIRQTQGAQHRRASYARGDGTHTLLLEYKVTGKDRDPSGVHIDNNAMLIKRSMGNVPLNKANVVGVRGGLRADLRANGLSRSQTGPVDGSRRLSLYCKTPLPEALAQIFWKWNGEQETSTKYSVKFTVHQDPGLGNDLDRAIFAAGNLSINNQRFLMGISNGARDPLAPAAVIKGVFCGTWDPVAKKTAHPTDDGWVVHPPNVAGEPTLTVISYPWRTGTYTMTVVRTQSSTTLGVSIYKCYVKADGDGTGGDGTLIGSFSFTHTGGDPGATINPNFATTGSSIAYTGPDPVRPVDIPVFEVEVNRPKFEGMRRPRHGVVAYSPVHGIADNARATFNASDQTITLLAGGETSRPATGGPLRFTFNAKRR